MTHSLLPLLFQWTEWLTPGTFIFCALGWAYLTSQETFRSVRIRLCASLWCSENKSDSLHDQRWNWLFLASSSLKTGTILQAPWTVSSFLAMVMVSKENSACSINPPDVRRVTWKNSVMFSELGKSWKRIHKWMVGVHTARLLSVYRQ